MTWCSNQRWTVDCLPIRSISQEEFQKELETDIPEIESVHIDKRFPVNIPESQFDFALLSNLENLDFSSAYGVGTGRLMRYSNCKYGGDYSGFKKGEFLYLNWKNTYLKIRIDCRQKVADEIVELSNYIRNEL